MNFEFFDLIPAWSVYAAVFVFGALIGSFMNVVIHRVPRELSVVFPNSACPKCGSPIAFYDNVPILSWIILGGRCRGCRSSISPRYPLVELLNAILYVSVLWVFGLGAFLPVAMLFTSAMVCLMLIDAEHMILPNVINFPLLAVFLAVRILFPVLVGDDGFPFLSDWPSGALADLPSWIGSAVQGVSGSIAGGGFLWLVGEIWKRFRGVDAMGLGDVKMMAAVGMLLGWKLTLLSIFIGALVGAVAGIAILSRQENRDLQTHIPFGIFLGLGSMIALLAGSPLIEWYLRTFVP
jgi:leader peptidase (prepilin peptidase)/N-methyltransferase